MNGSTDIRLASYMYRHFAMLPPRHGKAEFMRDKGWTWKTDPQGYWVVNQITHRERLWR